MQPTFCSTCQAPIVWVVRRDNGQWNRPLDAMSGVNGFVVVDGQVHVGTLYQPHQCNPEAVSATIEQGRIANAARAEALAQRQMENAARAESLARRQEEASRIREADHADTCDESDEVQGMVLETEPPEPAWLVKSREARVKAHEKHEAISKLRGCPKCGAKKGHLCLNMGYGPDKFTVYAHPERGGIE